MAHGKTLWLIGFSKAISEREPEMRVSIVRNEKGRVIARPMSYENPDKSRHLAGKKRIKARKAARR
jgi:hypothetical protein